MMKNIVDASTYWKNKKVLVTGGTGFLGKSLVKKLKQMGSDVYVFTSKEFDLTNANSCSDLFVQFIRTNEKFDYIFHLAAFQGAGEFTLKNTATQFHKNNLIHTNILKCWKDFQSQAFFVGMGSTCQYPADKEELREEDYMSGHLHSSVETYGLTKCLMTQGIKAYKQQYGMNGITVVLATLYGPYDSFDLERAHVVSALIKKFCDAKKKGIPSVEVWGDGNQTRELIYVEDQVDGILLGATCKNVDIINVGSGKRGETKIKDLAYKIKEISGYEGEIVFNENRFVGVYRKVLNIDKAKELVGWTETNKMRTLEEGLTTTIEWYEENNQ